ncbi:MAG: RNA polymerase sigma factor [Planctomycetaceae bacterium]
MLCALKDDVHQHQAWVQFVQRYGPRVESWCRRWGLQDADARDVAQNVMLKLARQMQTFDYDHKGSFRSWLKTIAWRSWVDFLKAQKRNVVRPSGFDALAKLDTVEAKDDLMEQLEEEANQEILEVAMNRVRSRVKQRTFEAFRLMTFERLSGIEAGHQLDMPVGSVFVAKSRVDKMLSEEVALLEP